MNRRLYSILAPIFILVIFACNINNPATPQAIAVISALTLSVQAQNAIDTSNAAGQVINYQYIVTNTGNVPLVGPVTVTDDKVMVTCPTVNTVGDLDNNLNPNETLTCTGFYTISQADLTTGSVTNNASASAAGTSSNPATSTVSTANNIALQTNPTQAAPTPSTSFVAGSTIRHHVEKGDWLMQIARCYGADYKATRRANPQIINPSVISINSIVTVPNIGSNGNMYGPPCVKYHTVQTGDTWTSIAQLYNADATILQAANRGVTLTAGRVVKVPVNSAGGSPQPPQPGNKTLTINVTGAGAVTNSQFGINCGSRCTFSIPDNTSVNLTASATSGSAFSNWGDACSSVGSATTCTITMNADQTVSANFTSAVTTKNLTVTISGTGTVTSNPPGLSCSTTCTVAFPINTVVTLTASPTAPATSASLSGAGCTGAGSCQVTMNADLTVTANFTSPATTKNLTVTITTGTGTVTSNPAGINCPTVCTFAFPINTQVSLTASPTAPATSASLSGAGCTGAGTCQLTTNADLTVTAAFNSPGATKKLKVTIAGAGTVVSDPAGINCISTCNFDFPVNTTVKLTASPNSPSTFTNWGGTACQGVTLVCTISMTGDQSVTATFTSPATTQTLTVNKAGLGKGVVTSQPAGIDCDVTCSSDSGDFPLDTDVTLSASGVGPLASFDHWEGACSGSDATCIVKMSQAQTVTASFRTIVPPINVTLTVNKTGLGKGMVTSQPAGIDCGLLCSSTSFDFPLGTEVKLSASGVGPLASFDHWEGACSGSDTTCIVKMNQVQTVTASFRTIVPPINVTLTVNKIGQGTGSVTSDPQGIDCDVSCTSDSGDFLVDTEVKLTASPSSPFEKFVEWTGGCSGTDPICTINTNQVKTVTARFEHQ